MKVGKWIVRLDQKEGYDLLAPITYWDASEKEIEKKTGGCGPGEIGDWFVPDTMYGESVFLACQVHDWCYGEGETLEDKKWADILFLINMTLLVLSDNGDFDIIRLRRVMSYFEAVYFGGKDAFKEGKTMKKEEI